MFSKLPKAKVMYHGQEKEPVVRFIALTEEQVDIAFELNLTSYYKNKPLIKKMVSEGKRIIFNGSGGWCYETKGNRFGSVEIIEFI